MIFRTPIWLWLLPALLLAGAWLAQHSSLPRTVLLLRGLITVLVVLALADPVKPGTEVSAPLLVLVDQSASIPEAMRDNAWHTAAAIARERDTGQTVVAGFADDVALSPDFQPPSLQRDSTKLAGALQFAQGLRPSSVLLLSDGAGTTPGAEQAAQALQEQGVPVDVLPLIDPAIMDARVAEFALPAGLRAEQSFRGEVILESTAATRAELSVSFNGQLVDERTIELEAGRTIIPLPGQVPDAGVQRLRAELQLPDAHPENNVLETTMLVGPPPKVLVVEQQPDSAAYLRDVLETQGIQSEALRPPNLSSRLSDLRRFDAIILQDISASAFTLDQQQALREYVHSLGHGMLALGGLNSYSLGEYKGTPLEEALPVSMEPPPRRERQQVALLLIIDRSASMYGSDPATSKLELAKGGALAATHVLGTDDRVGVLAFDTEQEWTVPFTRIGQGLALSEIQDRIATIGLGGGTDIYNALGIGIQDLARQDVAVRHAVLLTDGRSNRDHNSYDQLLADARTHGITLSTIAIGDDADTALLERLADRGSGRYHFTTDPEELPQLTLLETEIARDNPLVVGMMQPQPAGTHPITRGFIPRHFPQLHGYIGVTLKAEADLVLQSPEGDPILAAWQYGLGRALAWASDSGEQWGGDWQYWSESPQFWSQALAYLFPDPAQGPVTVRVDPSANPPIIVSEARNDDSTPIDLADIGARVRDPSGGETTLQLKQVAPGRYEAPLPVASDGAYTIGVVLRKGEQQFEASTGWTKPYSAEFAAQPNLQLLERIATISGGRVLQSMDSALETLQATEARPAQPFWPWLIGVALLLWPVEIAVRRGWLRWWR